MDQPTSLIGEQLDRIALYRWWRLHVVSSVDHQRVIDRIVEESAWSPRYLFMIMMSAGIAVLGLLLSSPAVVIGAMLISPLMSPILGLGFSMIMFDFAEARRSLIALGLGSLIAVLFTALIVLMSPLKAPTAEILARTQPNLFDLLVALFAALAGTFSIIRGRGETITGVAIATALMPPLAVVGYGLATWNMAVLGGSFALFATNLVTIAMSAAIMARFYGFGYRLSAQQSWLQTGLLLLVFIVMAVPLGISLARIAGEALTVNSVRAFLGDRYGARARVTQLDVDFDANPMQVRGVIIAPRNRIEPVAALRSDLAAKLGRPVSLQLDQVILDPGATALAAQKAELAKAQTAERAEEAGRAVARLVGLAAGVEPEAVTLDRDHQRAEASAAALPGANLMTYWAIEQRVRAAADGWDIRIIPPLAPLPTIGFADSADTLDAAARSAVSASIWAAKRWNVAALGVPGLAVVPSEKPLLAERRATAIAEVLKAQSIAVYPVPPAGQSFALVSAPARR